MKEEQHQYILINFNCHSESYNKSQQNFIIRDNCKQYFHSIHNENTMCRIKKKLLYIMHIHKKKKVWIVL